jgi:predicted TIM-barrel fold metal-dependent hydrolase
MDRWRTLVPMIPEQFQQRFIARLTDTSRRLELMDQGEIDLAVLSNVGTVQGFLEPRAALRMAREANDHLAEVVRARSDRFAAFATTPLQHPKEGADELQRAVGQLGLAGTMLFGHTGGRYLDDRSFDPFWERVQDLDVPVYLHAADAAAGPASQPVWQARAQRADVELDGRDRDARAAHRVRRVFRAVPAGAAHRGAHGGDAAVFPVAPGSASWRVR